MYLQLFKCYSRENFLECFQSLTGAEEGEEPVTYGVTLTGCVYSDLSHKNQIANTIKGLRNIAGAI